MSTLCCICKRDDVLTSAAGKSEGLVDGVCERGRKGLRIFRSEVNLLFTKGFGELLARSSSLL